MGVGLGPRPAGGRRAASRAATRRVAIGANMHMAVAAATSCAAGEMAAAPATSGARAAFGATLEAVARDGRGDRDRDQRARARTSPARPRPPRAPQTGWRIEGREDLLHHVAGRHACCSPPSPSSTTRASERYGYARIPAGDARRRRSTTTGTRWACAPRAATRSASKPSTCPKRPCAAASRPAAPTTTWRATSPPGCSTRRRRSASPRRREERSSSTARRHREPRRARADAGGRERDRAVRGRAAALSRGRRSTAPGRRPRPRGDGRGADRLRRGHRHTKAFVNEAAVRVVDRALALSGGAGYRSDHVLAPRLPRRSRRGVHAPARAPTAPTSFVGERRARRTSRPCTEALSRDPPPGCPSTSRLALGGHLLRHPAHRAQAPRQLHRRDHPVRRRPGPRRPGDLLHRRPARGHRPVRAGRAARAHATTRRRS